MLEYSRRTYLKVFIILWFLGKELHNGVKQCQTTGETDHYPVQRRGDDVCNHPRICGTGIPGFV